MPLQNIKWDMTTHCYARYFIAGSIRNKMPVIGPVNVSYWNNRTMMFTIKSHSSHTIRNVLNDSTLFFDILQTFYREHAASSHVTTADFMEVISGRQVRTGINFLRHTFIAVRFRFFTGIMTQPLTMKVTERLKGKSCRLSRQNG
jgi:hypothetical protein